MVSMFLGSCAYHNFWVEKVTAKVTSINHHRLLLLLCSIVSILMLNTSNLAMRLSDNVVFYLFTGQIWLIWWYTEQHDNR